MDDYEDALQAAAALAFGGGFIVTRNIADYRRSPVPAISPAEFMKKVDPINYPYDGDDPMAYARSGFIWDKVLQKGLSLRVYGEFVQPRITPRNATWTDIWNDYRDETRNVNIQADTELATLRPYLCPTFIGFPSVMQDVYRAQEFIKELREFEVKLELRSKK
jgi:hypothetical protein